MAKGNSAPDHPSERDDDAEKSELERLRCLNDRLIDERRAAELARDEYTDLYELAPLPALSLDAAYITRRMNRALRELLGIPSDHGLGQSFRGFVMTEDRRVLSEHLARTQYSPTTRCRLRLLPRSGPPIPVELWTNVLGRTGLYQLRVVDLREQERTATEMTQLVESERSARTESAAKDTFIAMLSHELRTPLTPALAIASFFRDAHVSRDVRRAFGVVERSLLSEVRMIDDLLDVNRVLRGKMAVRCRAASVHAIACEAAEELRPAAAAKQQTLALELRAERAYANVDPLRLRQVFANLIRNAIKFTPPAGNIAVRSWNNGTELVVEVEDDGIGIAPQQLHRLFVAFDQLTARPAATGGLGLGLAISRGLLELQRGRISAQSPGLGRGSRFVVELESIETPEATGPTASDALAAPIPSMKKGKRILLVEDDPDSSEVLSELLRGSGFDVETAGSLEAAKAVDLTRIDLVLSDIGLPDGSGLELIRELQANGHRPAIALTGYGRESDVIAALEAGFDAHLTKPVSIHLLLDLVKKLLA